MKALVLVREVGDTRGCPDFLQSLDRLSFGMITQRLSLDQGQATAPHFWILHSPDWPWDRVFLWTRPELPFPWDQLATLGSWSDVEVRGVKKSDWPSHLPCRISEDWT